MRARGALLALMPAALLAVSCSTAPPEIAQTFWQIDLVHNPASGASMEKLSLFVQVVDSEGISDLSSIYLLSDAKELYWRLDSSNWQYSDANGELWVGSNEIETPNGAPLPRGKYRVLLTNLAGQRVSGDIVVSADHLSYATAPFPSLSIAGSRLRVRSAFPETSIWLYNQSGALVGSRRGAEGELALASLLPPGAPRIPYGNAYAYAYDARCGCGLLNGPYAVNFSGRP